MNRKLRFVMSAAVWMAVIGPITMQAQEVPGPHPAYLHALSDLRAARHYLNDGWAWAPVKHDDDVAIREIDAAINEIKIASINDGKGLNDPFPVDRNLSRMTASARPMSCCGLRITIWQRRRMCRSLAACALVR